MFIDIIFFLISTLIYISPFNFGDNDNYIILSLVCLFYFLLKLYQEYNFNKKYFFINPIFLTFLFTFCLGQGLLSNIFIYLIDGGFKPLEYTSVLNYEKFWLKKNMYLNFISILFLWIGYKLPIGSFLNKIYLKIPLFRKTLNGTISKYKLVFISIIIYLFNIYLYKIGLFGRMISEEYFVAGEGFKGLYFLRVFSKLSYVTFFFFCLNKFKYNRKSDNILFYISLIIELFFGFIYGARSAFIYPILILFLAYYFINQKLNKYLVILILPLTILSSVTIVLSYKNFTLESDFVRSKSIFELVSAFTDFQKNTKSNTDESILLTGVNIFFKNTNYLQESSMLVRYTDENKNSKVYRTKIILQLFKAPFDTFIPKFIQGKNDFAWGLWLKNELFSYQVDKNYSLACGPTSFLYFGGGYFLLIIGFILYGICLKMVFTFLNHKSELIFLFYLLLISDTYMLESFYTGFLINITRDLLIFPMLFWFLFSKIYFEKKI